MLPKLGKFAKCDMGYIGGKEGTDDFLFIFREVLRIVKEVPEGQKKANGLPCPLYTTL